MYKELFSSITFGGMQQHGAVAALPVITPSYSNAISYLTLPEAIELMLLKIEEVSHSGSVPELKAFSSADLPILIIAGEEVRGARQNRILNTSILIPAKGELVIPVSCTERGRWSYSSPDLRDSGNLSSKEVRFATDQGVHFNLMTSEEHRSDQGVVWDKIEELHRKAGSDGTSRTRAMVDAYKSMADDLEVALRHFSLVPGQTGILFFHAGKVSGLDIISRPGAYARLHEKLVKSYLIDYLSDQPHQYIMKMVVQEVNHFLASAMAGDVKVFKSPGLGEDHRLTTAAINGSALVVENEPVHTCCFKTNADEQRMAGFGKSPKGYSTKTRIAFQSSVGSRQSWLAVGQ